MSVGVHPDSGYKTKMPGKQLPRYLLEEFNRYYGNRENDSIVHVDKQIKNKFEFQIQRFEDAVNVFKGSIPPNRFSHYYIALVTYGSGSKSIGLTTFNVSQGTVIFQSSGVVNSSRSFTPDTKGYILSFSSEFLLVNYTDKDFLRSMPFFQIGAKPYLYINENEQHLLSDVYERIISEYTSNKELKDELLRFYVFELIYKAKRLYLENCNNSPEGKNTGSVITNNFIKLVEQHFLEKRQVSFYADLLTIHPNHLNVTVKKNTGKTCSELLQDRILLEAKCLLKSSSMSVKEIAFFLSFEDAGYFSKYFKKHTAISPLEYRFDQNI